ncbi:hypothetical protein [Microbacterium sp. K41]|uniref:hypothetical protein n=1 Tax=Microbacterium sp. K41 TaxID=2305437 RepID=UPI00109C727B|nr:hypothetical protein [Microbacterium sp. K41]
MATVSGYLSDLTKQALSGRFPRLFFRIERPSTAGANLIVTDRVEATINDATGAFTVDLVASDELIPEVPYTVTADWDAGRQIDVLTGLRVPAAGGAISDLILASGLAAELNSALFGWGPPPPNLGPGLYYDLESGEVYGEDPGGN